MDKQVHPIIHQDISIRCFHTHTHTYSRSFSLSWNVKLVSETDGDSQTGWHATVRLELRQLHVQTEREIKIERGL